MANLDSIFHALSDCTRRAVVQQLTGGPASVKTLAEPHAMALPTFLKHLQVLEACDLIVTRKTGRVRTCALQPETAQAAEHWLSTQRGLWERRLDRLDSFLTAQTPKDPDDAAQS